MSLRGILDYSSSDDENETEEDKDSQVLSSTDTKNTRNTEDDFSGENKNHKILTSDQDVRTNNSKSENELDKIHAEPNINKYDTSPDHAEDYEPSAIEEIATLKKTEVHAEPDIDNHDINPAFLVDYEAPYIDEEATTEKTEMLRLPGMSKKEMEGLKCAVWKDVFPESTLDKSKHYTKSNQESVKASSEEQRRESQTSTWTEYNYEYYQYHYNQYQLYMENCRKNGGYSEEVARQYCDWLADFYTKLCKNDGSLEQVNHSRTQAAFKHKSFEELQAQDRELEKYFESPQNTFGLSRSVFKPTFRGTRTYQEHNKTFNPAHFNTLTKGAKNLKAQFESSGINDKNIERLPKSNKQKKREAWRDAMKAKIRKC